MSDEEEGGAMGRPADGVLVRPLPIPDVAWMLDRVPVMGEDVSSGVTGPAGTRINADVRRATRKSRMNRKRKPFSAKDHKATARVGLAANKWDQQYEGGMKAE